MIPGHYSSSMFVSVIEPSGAYVFIVPLIGRDFPCMEHKNWKYDNLLNFKRNQL